MSALPDAASPPCGARSSAPGSPEGPSPSWGHVARLVDAECKAGLGFEGRAAKLPHRVTRWPSDLAGHRKLLEDCSRMAVARAKAEVAWPLACGRCCLAGLVLLEVIRITEWVQGRQPYFTVLAIHCLAGTADLACVVCSLPLYAGGVRGECVSSGCLGPLLTLVFAMTLVSVSSFVAFLWIATPRPVSQGSRSWLDLMEANATAWEFTLLASVALNVVLCKVSWGVYRALRLTGLYPPGMEPVGLGRIRTVSPWEVFCEAEDLECFGVCDQTPAYATAAGT